jgi:hypothetical protein
MQVVEIISVIIIQKGRWSATTTAFTNGISLADERFQKDPFREYF